MNKYFIFILTALLVFAGSDALARDTRHHFSIADVMEKPENISRLEGVSFYFGDQGHPSVSKNHGEFRTNKKTNAFNKSDLEACEWAMMSALLQLHLRAQDLGANAVINIQSNYKDQVESSETDYTCGAGAIMAGVALIGTIVVVE